MYMYYSIHGEIGFKTFKSPKVIKTWQTKMAL